MLGQQIMAALAIRVFSDRTSDIKVITPAGQLKAVIAKTRSNWRHFFKGEIGPLAGKEGDWSMHGVMLLLMDHPTGQRGCSTGDACSSMMVG